MKISKLPLLFRLPWDYAKSLAEGNKVSTVVDSIMNLPWLFVQSNTEDQTLTGTDLPEPHRAGGGNQLSYFNKQNKELHTGSNGYETIEYFLDVEVNHPISDKNIYRMTFCSSLKATKLNNYQGDTIDFSDILQVGELHKNYLNQKEILIPDHAFVLHLKLTIPSFNRRKLYSCLVCSTKDFLERDFTKGLKQDFSVALQIDNRSFITLKLRTFKVDLTTETGAAVMSKMYPSENQAVLKNFHMFRFILYETVCDCQFEPTEVKRVDPRRPQNGHKQSAEYLGQPDYYTIYNTQNNYYFQSQSAMNEQYQYQQPMGWKSSQFTPRDAYNQSYSRPGPNSFYEPMYAKGNRFPEAPEGQEYWGKFQAYEKDWNLQPSHNYAGPTQRQDYDRQEPSLENSSIHSLTFSHAQMKESQSWIHDPQASPPSSNGHHTLQHQHSSQSDQGNYTHSEEGSSAKSPDGEELCTLEEILRFPKLFKHHANSKSKNPLIQRLVKAMGEEETLSMLATLKPLAKEVCKNKYGNYIIQVIAKSINQIYLETFLDTVRNV